jgi:hypothetical protein
MISQQVIKQITHPSLGTLIKVYNYTWNDTLYATWALANAANAFTQIDFVHQLTQYTSSQETTLAGTLTGQAAYSTVIYNTTLGVSRYWNGTAFATSSTAPTVPQGSDTSYNPNGNWSATQQNGANNWGGIIGTISNQTDLNTTLSAKAPLASPTFTGTPITTTATGGTNTTQIASTAFVATAVPNSSYRTLMEGAGSLIAAKVAGTYMIPMGDALAVSGTGTLYPIQIINLVGADFPTVNGFTTKLRIRASVSTNATAPTGNFTIGLYPVTSGGGATGLKIYTVGTLVSGSATSTVTAPALSTTTSVVSSDFALPADGLYCLAVVTTATVATSSLVHLNAQLQLRNA